MSDAFKFLLFWVIALVVISAASFGIYAVVFPAQIAVQNNAFHNSQPYNDGMTRDLANFQMEYLGTQDEGKRSAIRAIVINRFAAYDSSRLPADLQQFLYQLKSGN